VKKKFFGINLIKSFIINLDRDKERYEFCSNKFLEYKCSINRFNAFDGSKITDKEFDQFCIERPLFNKNKGKNGMACHLSHEFLWNKVVEERLDCAAIFEDDIWLSPTIVHLLNDTKWLPEDFDIIRLEAGTNRILLSSDFSSVFDRKLHCLLSNAWGTAGYIISKKGAKKILSFPNSVRKSCDWDLYASDLGSIISKQIIKYQIHPAVCIQDKFYDIKNIRFKSSLENYKKSKFESSFLYKLYSLKDKNLRYFANRLNRNLIKNEFKL
jgi:glycosyl transferase, family 25